MKETNRRLAAGKLENRRANVILASVRLIDDIGDGTVVIQLRRGLSERFNPASSTSIAKPKSRS